KSSGVHHVTEEGGHLDSLLLGDRLDHEVGPVPDVRVGAHEYSAQTDGRKERRWKTADLRRQSQTSNGKEKRQIGWGVIQETREGASNPEEVPGLVQPDVTAVRREDLERWYHRHEDPNEQDGDLTDGLKREAVLVVNFRPRQLVGKDRHQRHHGFAQGRR